MLYVLDSLPCWTEEDWTPYRRGVLRSWDDITLLEHMQLEVERLLRIVDTPPRLLGEAVWTHSLLGTCEHLAQLNRELRRRCGTHAARVGLRHLLISYVCWFPEEEESAPAGEIVYEEDEEEVSAASGVL